MGLLLGEAPESVSLTYHKHCSCTVGSSAQLSSFPPSVTCLRERSLGKPTGTRSRAPRGRREGSNTLLRARRMMQLV